MFGSIFSWWVVVQVVGLAGLPLTGWLLRTLPLRGYPFAKALGLLLVGYLSWLLAMSGLVPFGSGAILLALGLVVGAGWWTTLRGRTRDELVGWARARWRPLLAYEVLFALALYAGLWLRWHFEWSGVSVASTEKPMDLAFLSGIASSTSFPPQDPWLAGYPINYYYLGYVMVAVLKVLSGVGIGEALTLGVATSFALAALLVAGLVATLATLHWRGDAASAEDQPARRTWGGIAAAAALGVVLVLVAGNQHGLLQNIFGHESAVALDGGQLVEGLQQRLGGAEQVTLSRPIPTSEFNGPVSAITPRAEDPNYPGTWFMWWWWPSRGVWDEVNVNRADPNQPEQLSRNYNITEVPFFSLFLGDMHPHVLAMPFALLAVALALATLLRPSAPRFLSDRRGLLELAITGVIIGSLYAINSWDAPTYALLYAGALALLYRRMAREAPAIVANPEDGTGAYPLFPWREYAQMLGSVGLAALLLLAPFLLSFKSLVGNRADAGAWEGLPLLGSLGKTLGPVPDHTDLHEFVIIFGLFFVVLLAYALLSRGTALGTGRRGVFSVVAQPLASSASPRLSGWVVTGVVFVLGALVGFPYLGLLPLAGTVALEAWRVADRPVRAFTLWAFAATAFVLFMTDLVYIRDHFDNRMNTVFKFYYQVWILWGTLAGYAAWALLRRARRFPGLTAAWALPAALLLVGALVYPTYILRYNLLREAKPEIDALAFLNEWLPDEAAAIEWIKGHTATTDIVLTAFGDGYDDPGRVAAATGRPTLLGWNYSHEQLWRGGDDAAMTAINERAADIPTIYGPDTPESQVYDLLRKHNVRYVYVGRSEREKYAGADRFQGFSFVEQVFTQGEVQIYRLR